MKLNAATDVAAELPEPDVLALCQQLGLPAPEAWQRKLLDGRVVTVHRRHA